MKEFRYILNDPEGIHARPAGELVKKSKTFKSDIKIGKAGRFVSCKAILGIMGLGAKTGEEVTLTFQGEDEEEAFKTIKEFMENTL